MSNEPLSAMRCFFSTDQFGEMSGELVRITGDEVIVIPDGKDHTWKITRSELKAAWLKDAVISARSVGLIRALLVDLEDASQRLRNEL